MHTWLKNEITIQGSDCEVPIFFICLDLIPTESTLANVKKSVKETSCKGINIYPYEICPEKNKQTKTKQKTENNNNIDNVTAT